MNTTTKETFFVVIILLVSFSFLLGAIISGNWTDEIFNFPPYLDGLVIASGIFVAFLCATVISRAKDIDRLDFAFVRLSLFTFIAAMFWLAYQTERGYFMTMTQLGLLSASLTLCGFTTWRIMNTLYRKSHS